MSAPYTRTTHTFDGDLVVFHIGMTFRKPHRPDLWMPVFTAMPKMLAELERNKVAAARGEAEDLGFLGARQYLGARGPLVVQWWRSTEQLYAYASATDHAHLPAWRAFNQAVRKGPGAVGIWHETYAVRAGGVETIYGGAEGIGLGGVVGTVPVERRGRSASERLGSRVA
ncbi:DUF4188 domain-containing protein [Knoellia aerolata]|uniref:DUF4188 domain-containing protein n=1 Tax=Knoellia aerolata DSM 18566 TaxID=1385519 RepID=A0A0A0JZZ2_9MICO|nr:DUF4188 domain-containing protein [Knoellia aerolata]KGN41647.1 hypothetical protein N801_06490 [Knoellia aerolata DSM 18566]